MKTTLIFLLIGLLLISGCKDYASFYDECIERNPDSNIYCECISIYSDGYGVVTDEAGERCWMYKDNECKPK